MYPFSFPFTVMTRTTLVICRIYKTKKCNPLYTETNDVKIRMKHFLMYRELVLSCCTYVVLICGLVVLDLGSE